MKICRVVILKDNIVAIRISTSGSRSPIVYSKSPILAWQKVIIESFYEKKLKNLQKYLIKRFVANNYIGLVQIKVFGGKEYLFREIHELLRLRWGNIFYPQFWFFVFLTVLLPSNFLDHLATWYKKEVNKIFIDKKILNGWS